MIATLLHREGIHTTHLPEKTHGQHWLHTSPQPSEATRAISIEGIESDREGEDGYWLITTNQDADILDNNGNTIESCALQPFTMYPLRLRKTGAKALLYIEPATLGRQQYRKYRAADNAIVSIGRHEGNTIVINSPYVSEYHARIDTSVNSWSIISDGINGTCVNGKRVKEKALRTGDSIAILAGCKIIVAGNIIAINNPDGKVRVKTDLLKPIEETRPKPSSDDDANNTSITLFSRSPRFEQEFKPPTFKIEAPPPNQLGEQTPIMMTLGPALTMGLASSTMLIFAVVNGMSRGNLTSAIPMIAMSVSMLCGVVLWPILSRKHNKKNRQQKEALRQEKYSAYLQDFSNSLTKECRRQEEYRRKTCVHINECISRIENRERTLWERRPGQDDFLTLRIGLGEQELQANVNFPEDKFTLEDDHLKKQLLDICQARHPLHSVPMTISLLRDPISGVIGDRRQVIEHIKGLIIQTAALYSYDEVKLAVFYDIEEENHFGFTKWLPHIWDNTRSFRLLARTDGEMKEISAYFEQVIDHRIQTGERDMDAAKPHYIILSLSHTLAKKTDILKRIYAQKKDLHISVLTAYNKLSNLPIESTLVVELYNPETSMTGELSGEVSRKLADKSKDSQDAANKTTYYAGLPVAGKYYTQDNPGVVTPFTPDIQVRTDTRTSPAKLALQLANTHLDTLAAAFQLPTTLTFLEMFSVGKLQHLN
ncbi:MAG: FHA domain-containing protein, partial [Peptococcaceae bacterium]|nr:FHA domain-containing protein [Peptococcaceae bacterium]